jgi:Tfp pilus assembly protein PilP
MATWFAVSPKHAAPVSTTQAPQYSAAAHSMTAEQLNTQAARLREFVAAGQLRPSSRNPFRFGTAKRSAARVTPAPAAPMIAAAEPAPLPLPAYVLSGLAERDTPEGKKRTAVVTGADQLYVVGEGDLVGGRFRVVRIDSNAVLLRDQTGTELTLAMRP